MNAIFGWIARLVWRHASNCVRSIDLVDKHRSARWRSSESNVPRSRTIPLKGLVTWTDVLLFVFRAVTDPRDGRRVALKKLPNVFQSLVSSKRVFRELKMLCFFKHENVSFDFPKHWRFVDNAWFHCSSNYSTKKARISRSYITSSQYF